MLAGARCAGAPVREHIGTVFLTQGRADHVN